MLSGRPTPTATSPDDVLGTREASIVARVSERTLLKLANSGELPMKRVGRQWRIRRGTLLAWLDGRES